MPHPKNVVRGQPATYWYQQLLVAKDLPTKSLFPKKSENYIKSPKFGLGSISRLCEFLVVLIQGFRDLSDCSQSYCVSRREFCQFSHGFEDLGWVFPPNRRTAKTTLECPASSGRSVRPDRSVRRVLAGVSALFLQNFLIFVWQFPLLFGVSFLVIIIANYKLPHQHALRRHPHELQAIPLTSIGRMLQWYTVQLS